LKKIQNKLNVLIWSIMSFYNNPIVIYYNLRVSFFSRIRHITSSSLIISYPYSMVPYFPVLCFLLSRFQWCTCCLEQLYSPREVAYNNIIFWLSTRLQLAWIRKLEAINWPLMYRLILEVRICRTKFAVVCWQNGFAGNELSVDDVIKLRDSEIVGSQWEGVLPGWSREAQTNYGEQYVIRTHTPVTLRDRSSSFSSFIWPK